MTNNQWNKLAGARWKALSEEQQAPYHRMAEADKRRYNQVSALHRLCYY